MTALLWILAGIAAWVVCALGIAGVLEQVAVRRWHRPDREPPTEPIRLVRPGGWDSTHTRLDLHPIDPH